MDDWRFVGETSARRYFEYKLFVKCYYVSGFLPETSLICVLGITLTPVDLREVRELG